jgi:hypothetical protein
MAKRTLPSQALENAADQAHLPTVLPPPSPSQAETHPQPHTLPSQAIENAADQAHLPTVVPPPSPGQAEPHPQPHALPSQALENAADQAHLPTVVPPSSPGQGEPHPQLHNLPAQALENAADQAKFHRPAEVSAHFADATELDFDASLMPSQALDHAADQAQLPTELPPSPPGQAEPHLPTLPDQATDHMSPIALMHLHDWLLGRAGDI